MKITEKDFDAFKVYCTNWQREFGLLNWSIYFEHARLTDEYAQTAWKTTEMMATITLAKNWDNLRPKTRFELNRLALHEVLHILLAPLVSEAEWRFTSQDAIKTAEHSIVRNLEQTLL